MNAIAAILIAMFFTTLFWWVDRETAKRWAREDEQLRRDIAHLPEDVQAKIWEASERYRMDHEV